MKLLQTQQTTNTKIEFLMGVSCAFGTAAWIGFLLNANTPVLPYLALFPMVFFAVYTFDVWKELKWGV